MQISEYGIVYADSSMAGMPSLDNTAGSLIAVLDAVLPAAGWEKAFSGTNKAAYRSSDVTGTRLFLRVDDTDTYYSRIRGYEDIADQTAFDSDVATGPFSTDAQVSGGLYCYKAGVSGARDWTLFSDGRMIYFFCDPITSQSWYGGFFFGDLDSYIVSDAFCSVLVGSDSSSWPFNAYSINGVLSGHYIARQANQAGGSQKLGKYSHGKTAYLGTSGPTYAADNLLLWPVEGWDGSSAPRGLFPGLWNPVSDSVAHGEIIDGVPQLSGRTLLTQRIYTSRACAIDITGPWR